ncbi:MAG: hypothetical protein PHW79_11315 [Candidatus Marinimicrobia bacterium]|nr:hypothetical protein [Candidatus Neomarinimicrobiota bacterium]
MPGVGAQGFLILDGQNWKLIRFDSSGEKIGEMKDFQDFIDIAIE